MRAWYLAGPLSHLGAGEPLRNGSPRVQLFLSIGNGFVWVERSHSCAFGGKIALVRHQSEVVFAACGNVTAEVAV